MTPDPHQRSSRSPSSSRAAKAPTSAAKTQAAARAAAARTRPSSGSDEFARLMRNNTVDVRQQQASARQRRRSPLAGKLALGLAVVSAAVDASAFAVYMGGDTTFAFGICFVVVFLTLIAAILGFIAAVGGLGRWYGAIGVVLAFFANPVILIVLVVMVAPELLTDMSA
ncbi:hypothetical protein [Curtobacterium sp. MMLR14_010]|uniref:hypothetical protein n=1 Tax=Curtobacterium sp. MMLR14_010 TaxID=1898743 RepID=UPI000AB54BBD|nr:hypothetical protein [Curtobacterium sp. MMLR14_010]